MARSGAGQITGFDIEPARIAALKRGEDRTGEVAKADLANLPGLAFSADPAALVDQDIYIVTVPTPVDAENRPDLGPLLAACESVGRALAARAPAAGAPIIVFESTVYPGVTEDICGPAIARSAGRELFAGLFTGADQPR